MNMVADMAKKAKRTKNLPKLLTKHVAFAEVASACFSTMAFWVKHRNHGKINFGTEL